MTHDRCPFEDDVLVAHDGVLTPVRRLVVEAHLGVCESCAALDETLDGASAAIRTSNVPTLGAADRALARIDVPRAPLRLARGAAAAAAVVAAVALAATHEPPDIRMPRRNADAPRVAAAPDVRVATAPTASPPDTRPRAPATTVPSPEGPAEHVPPSLADLDERIAELGDGDDADDEPRLDAVVRRIVASGLPGSAALAAILDGDDAALAARALRVSARMRSPSLVPALARRLDDAELGPEAARQLGAHATPAAVEALARAVHGPSRAAAVEALGAIHSSRAFDALVTAARSGAVEEPDDVLRAIVDSSPDDAARVLIDLSGAAEVSPLAHAARAVLRDRHSDVSKALLRLVRGDDAPVAAGAILAFGRARDTSAIAPLRAAGSKPALSAAAARALAEIGSDAAWSAAFEVVTGPRAPRGLAATFDGARDAADVLIARTADSRLDRRAAAVECLGWTRSDRAVPALARALGESSLRRVAAEALGRIGGDAAAAALADAARMRSPDVDLVRALGETGSAVAVAPLRSLAREPALATSVASALGMVPDAESVLALADLLAEPRTARAAAESLGAMPASVVVPALLESLDEPGAAARAHRALVLVSGSDLGRASQAWRSWWERRSGRSASPRQEARR